MAVTLLEVLRAAAVARETNLPARQGETVG
jgi:hypothetical protein